MIADLDRRRVLLLTGAAEGVVLRGLFAEGLLAGWEGLEADTCERARFILQHEPCDALLVGEELYLRDGPDGVAWLARQEETPVLLLAEPRPELVARALEQGVHQWLPMAMAVANPGLLAAALNQAARRRDLLRRPRQGDEVLRQCRRQVDRLVDLLWKTVPREGQGSWFTQRHMMERLHEEVARSERHGAPLAVALGEVRPSAGEAPAEEATDTRTAERISRTKRRCDVVGQYGPKGFMLLLVHTSREGAAVCCRRLQHELEQAHDAPREPHHGPRAYFGVASLSATTATPKGLLRCAEQNLEAAKEGAGGRVVS
jgi:PleD family two-component response regulator